MNTITITNSDFYCNEYKLQLLTVTFIVINTITNSDGISSRPGLNFLAGTGIGDRGCSTKIAIVKLMQVLVLTFKSNRNPMN